MIHIRSPKNNLAKANRIVYSSLKVHTLFYLRSVSLVDLQSVFDSDWLILDSIRLFLFYGLG